MRKNKFPAGNSSAVGLQYICYTQSIKEEAKSGGNKDSGT